VSTPKGVITVIGNDGWYIRGQQRAISDEQAIDVGALVKRFLDAYRITGKVQYYQNACTCFSWFTGNNRLQSLSMTRLQEAVSMAYRFKKA